MNSPVDRVLVSFVDIGYRGCCSRGRRRENMLGWLWWGRWILRVCRPHTPEVWTVMEAGNTPGAPVWIVQPCTTSSTSALEITRVQPSVVILKEKEKLVRIVHLRFSVQDIYIYFRDAIIPCCFTDIIFDTGKDQKIPYNSKKFERTNSSFQIKHFSLSLKRHS